MGNMESSELKTQNKVRFTVNGKVREVGEGVDPHTKLVTFIRDHLGLKGTKLSCGEGGCGSCVVTASYRNPGTGLTTTKPVNSCLIPVLSCDGWEISTVEHLGNRKAGFHPLQTRLSAYNASQCGFCSPGIVMTINSLLKENQAPDMLTLEKSLDGTICRCTGYRPILDAVKSFAGDGENITDIEDMGGWVCPAKVDVRNEGETGEEGGERDLLLQFPGCKWFSPSTLPSLLQGLKNLDVGEKYKLVAGNTGTGVYKEDETTVQTFIDISKIPELKEKQLKPLELGGGLSIADTMAALRMWGEMDPSQHSFASQITRHLETVANFPVRAVGTLAGNIMLKYLHRDFPSDILILLEAANAKIRVMDCDGGLEEFSPEQFLNSNMEKKIIYRICLPEIDSTNQQFRSYKVSPREVNAHAHVSAAVLFTLQDTQEFLVKNPPNIVFSGVSGSFLRAAKTGAFLAGKSLLSDKVLQEALTILGEELEMDSNPVLTSQEYRRSVCQSLLYRCVLSIVGEKAGASYQSGAEPIVRGLSEGQQEYQTDSSLFPITKPVIKTEAGVQCSGEAEYIGDIPHFPNQLFAAYVLSSQANCTVDSVDPSAGLALGGVVAYLDHTNIPGPNNAAKGKRYPEEIFTSGKVEYAGQPIGLVVGESQAAANRGANLVRVSYSDINKPILTIKEAITDPARVSQDPVGEGVEEGDAEAEIDAADVKVEGEFEIGSQYHMHMETQICICVPREDSLDVYSSTQHLDKVQEIVASATGAQEKDINVSVRRLGGAYGGKISRSNQVAAACAVAADQLQRPVRLELDLATNMRMMGKRLPYYTRYKAGLDASGKLTGVSAKIYCDSGYSYNESTADGAAYFAKNCYIAKAWKLEPVAALTNTPSNTYVRAPGTTQGHAIIEYIMEHAATQLGVDPLKLRMDNMLGDGDEKHPLREILGKLTASAEYEKRKQEITEFNQNNVWKKRGQSIVPIKYRHGHFGTMYNVTISVYHGDGTVAVTHGGVEMGQGINTKVAQVVSKELGIPLESVAVKPTNTMTNPNGSVTGGSMGSECNCAAAIIACEKLKSQMSEVRGKMSDPTWLDLVRKCYSAGVDLSARHMGHSGKDNIPDYDIWGAVATVVQIDVLTGQMQIERSDLIIDTGVAISPEVDVGQVEGGFVMGLGLWTSEQIRYDPSTGQLLDASTWEYKVPTARDIPADMRIEFYNSERSGPAGPLGSKATGEPSVLAGVSVLFAARQAIAAARKQQRLADWFQFNGPATVESVKLACGITQQNMKILE